MPARVVDLRSDTLTQPTDEMREAMRSARVGDDVYGEDPTVNELQERAARRFGVEAGLFMPSGTMGNEVALFVHGRRDGEVVLEERSHIVLFEQDAAAALAGLQLRTVPGVRGVFTPEQVRACLRDPRDPHGPWTRVVSIENTHNLAGGTVWTRRETEAVARVAHDHDAAVHVDGARIFNSAVAQGVGVERLVRGTDSVMFSLSKGLSAPVGSLLLGSQGFVERAWRVRKMFGGGMRQAGHLAAAGIVALETMVDRLAQDHANARDLARGLSRIAGLEVDLEAVQTNIVVVETSGTGRTAGSIVERLARGGVRCLPLGTDRIRLVTHRHVRPEDVPTVVAAFEDALRARTTARQGRPRSSRRP